jgi:hypothetical protein
MKNKRKLSVITIGALLLLLVAASATSAAVVDKAGSFYKIKIETSGDGDSRTAVITVTGTKGYHCNKLYPWKLTLKPSEGITLKKIKFKKGDATKFAEKAVVFTVPYMAVAKAKTVTAKLKLSLCDDKQCQMESVNLSWPAR